ncbi:hypothetical protein H632_c1837p0, partial [Helicosporidium sp. ATCC 50920]
RPYHSFHYMGPAVSLLIADMRTLRTKNRCLSRDCLKMLADACMTIPNHVEHLVVASGVPVIWPAVPYSEKFMKLCSKLVKFSSLARKTGHSVGFLDRFEQPEILDDMRDGWMADEHREERQEFIDQLHAIAVIKRVRISIISGDAHVAGVGRLYSYPKIRPLSAIMNAAPPHPVVRLLTRTNFASRFRTGVRQKMVRAFFPEHSSIRKLLPHRNWCDVTVVAPPYAKPMAPSDDDQLALRFMIRAERPGAKYVLGRAEEQYEVCVPRYVADGEAGFPPLTPEQTETLADASCRTRDRGIKAPALYWDQFDSANARPLEVPPEADPLLPKMDALTVAAVSANTPVPAPA